MINIIEDCGVQAIWTIGNFKHAISYLKDFTVDILGAMRNFLLDQECQEFQVDEGEDFYTIYIGFPVYARINEEEDLIKLEEDAIVFIQEMTKEIKANIDIWISHFDVDNDETTKAKVLKQIEEIELLISASKL